jgi:predicted PurR-regulated permease PerM
MTPEAKAKAIETGAWGTIGVLLVISGIALLYGARDVIVLFAVALLLSYTLLPAVSWVEMLLPPRVSRNVALAGIYISLLVVIASLATAIGGRAVEEGAALFNRLPQLLSDPGWIDRLPLPTWVGPLRLTITDALHRELANPGKTLLPYLEFVAKAIALRAGSLLYVILIPVLAFFFLKDGDTIRELTLDLVGSPARRASFDLTLMEIHSVLGRYIRALLLLSVATFIAYTIFLSVIRVPYAVLLATTAALLEVIPVVGPLAGGLAVMLVAILTGFPHLLWILVFWAVYRVFQDYVLSPWLMSAGVEVHPLLVLFAVLAGEELAGIPGMVFSVPVVAVTGVLLRRIILTRSQHRLAATPVVEAPKP